MREEDETGLVRFTSSSSSSSSFSFTRLVCFRRKGGVGKDEKDSPSIDNVVGRCTTSSQTSEENNNEEKEEEDEDEDERGEAGGCCCLVSIAGRPTTISGVAVVRVEQVTARTNV